jgi:serine/threonine protein kinase
VTVPSSQRSSRFVREALVAGKYRLRRRLATGGMGEVWVACNEATSADVALKVLRAELQGADADDQADLAARFRQEARVSARLAHRNIVRVFDLVEENDGTLVLVLELLRGETLHDYVQRVGPRPPIEAVAIVTHVLAGLTHAHERGLIHRDVSPANVFVAVDPDGHVTPKLVDFGLAKPLDATSPVRTVEGDVLGTPRYMAPERVRGDEGVDGRADVFSAAVVLVEIITGVSPFAAAGAAASLAAVLERTVDPDPRIPPPVWLEIRRALSKQAYERHATSSEFSTSLKRALGSPDEAIDAALQQAVPRASESTDDDGDGMSLGSVKWARGPANAPRSRVVFAAVLGVIVVGGAVGAVTVSRKASSLPSLPAAERTASSSPAPPSSLSSLPLPPSASPSAPSPFSAPPSSPPSVVTAAVAPSPRPTSAGSVPRPRAPSRPVATTPGF